MENRMRILVVGAGRIGGLHCRGGDRPGASPPSRVVYACLETLEARRAREAAARQMTA
jgi:hypothetical protein